MGKEIVKGPGQTEGQITGGKTGREVHLRVGMSVNVCVCVRERAPLGTPRRLVSHLGWRRGVKL